LELTAGDAEPQVMLLTQYQDSIDATHLTGDPGVHPVPEALANESGLIRIEFQLAHKFHPCHA
jgi:hypothetical protein